jgi:hypothetical protein
VQPGHATVPRILSLHGKSGQNGHHNSRTPYDFHGFFAAISTLHRALILCLSIHLSGSKDNRLHYLCADENEMSSVNTAYDSAGASICRPELFFLVSTKQRQMDQDSRD